MVYSIENGILVNCDECVVDINTKIKRKTRFTIKKLDWCSTTEESKKEILTFIIGVLYNTSNYYEAPMSSRANVSKVLIEHGQFKKEEIDEIFDQHSYLSADYTSEFFSNNPTINPVDLVLGNHTGQDVPLEKKYNVPIPFCHNVRDVGFCKMKIETLKCPDCGTEVENTPDNVSLSPERDLLCPVCTNDISNDNFERRGILKFGNPTHHGHWDTQKPEIVYTGTDYFAVLHPICKKSKRPDKKGVMVVNGVWAEGYDGRIVLSLECIYCGARNALKPFKKRGAIPVLAVGNAKWKHIESPILELIKNDESRTLEFKSSLRWDYSKNNVNKELEYEVAQACAAFMNSDGGTILIGVGPDKNILGITKDYATLGKTKGRDGFELCITNVINQHLGKAYHKFLRVDFENLDGNEICYIEVKKSPVPVYIKSKNNIFVIRSGNSTQTLDSKEAVTYISQHFETGSNTKQ